MNTVEPLRVVRSYTMKLKAPAERVFPLLCPVWEHEYLEDWNAEVLFSESGVAEPGCVFQTPNPSGPPTVWYITVHDEAAGRIQFVTFTASARLGQLDVLLRRVAGGATEAEFTYTHTAVSREGRRFIAAFTGDAFRRKMVGFEERLNEYLVRTAGG